MTESASLPALHHGDALSVLSSLPDAVADALVTDPPYSSGGLLTASRQQPPEAKYPNGPRGDLHPSFHGDTRDQRSHMLWMSMWLQEARRILRPGARVMVFTDWRQLPLTTDALQYAGFLWRGVIAWDKGGSARAPHTGYFRHQCEYIVWGSLGPLDRAAGQGGPFPGCVRLPVIARQKLHMTAKPIALMRELLRPLPPGSHVIDPFMGSGSTGVAAVQAALRFTGVELDAHYFSVARQRIYEAATCWRTCRARALFAPSPWPPPFHEARLPCRARPSRRNPQKNRPQAGLLKSPCKKICTPCKSPPQENILSNPKIYDVRVQ